MKGLSETISTVMLIALAVIITIGIYYWAAGQTFNTQPPHTEVVGISVTAVDVCTGDYLVTNVDTAETDGVEELQTSAGYPCGFGSEITLSPGESDNCTMDFGVDPAPTGTITFYTDTIGPAAVVVSTVDC